MRDLLSWVTFINATGRSLGYEHAFIHGAFLVLLDGLSLGTLLVLMLLYFCFSIETSFFPPNIYLTRVALQLV